MNLIQDIKPRTGFAAMFERTIEPRRLELAKHMGTLTQIPVIDLREREAAAEARKIMIETADPAGDFSGASFDEDGGR